VGEPSEKRTTLGWGVVSGAKSGKRFHKISLPAISQEEEELLCTCVEEFGKQALKSEVRNGQQAGEVSSRILVEQCEAQQIELDNDQRDYLAQYLYLHCWGYFFLDKLLEDSTIEEIAVIGIGKPAFVYVQGEGWKETAFGFTSESTAIEAINKMSRAIGRRITFQSPRLNAILADGTRLHATIPPVSKTEITLRRFRTDPIGAPQLGSLKTSSYEALAFLWLVMQSDASVLVCGNTASGKTTTLNALFNFVPADERVLMLEETPEISIPHRHAVRLVEQADAGIGLCDLVADSLRMRPDRVVIGEVRTQKEAQAFMESILSGQARGAYATYHAQSAGEACLRLAAQGVMEIDLPSIDLVVVQRRIGKYTSGVGIREVRRIVQIAEVAQGNGQGTGRGGDPKVLDLFSYDYSKDLLAMAQPDVVCKSKIAQKVCHSHSMSQRQLLNAISKRAAFLRKIAAHKGGVEKTMQRILEFR